MGPTTDPVYSLPVNGAIGKYLRVVLTAGVLALAGTTDYELGVTNAIVYSTDTVAPVRLRNATGIDIMVASVAITAGNPVYAGASGKVAATGTIILGTALDAATADGDHIRVLRSGPQVTFGDTGTNQATFTVDADSAGGTLVLKANNNTNAASTTIQALSTQSGAAIVTLPAGTVTLSTLAGTETFTNKTLTAPTITLPSVTKVTEKHTAGDTLAAAESGSQHSNTGASGTVTLVLPAAVAGLEFWFYVGAAFELRLDPNGSETIALPSTGVQGAAGKYLVADAVGEYVRLICETAGTWLASPYAGTWTAEG